MNDAAYSIELKTKTPENIADDNEVCSVPKCNAEAVSRYRIGPVSIYLRLPTADIDLCRDHDSEDRAFDLYGQASL